VRPIRRSALAGRFSVSSGLACRIWAICVGVVGRQCLMETSNPASRSNMTVPRVAARRRRTVRRSLSRTAPLHRSVHRAALTDALCQAMGRELHRSRSGFSIRDARLTGVDRPRGKAITVDLR